MIGAIIHLIFNVYDENYKDMYHSLVFTFHQTLGEVYQIEYETLKDSVDITYLRIFNFILLVSGFFFIVLMLNILIAILSNVYDQT